jgi:hypothetical protein
LKAIGLAAAVLFAVACAQSSIAGYAVGERRCDGGLPIDASETQTCDQFTAYARTRLDATAPSHAPVVAVEVYQDPVLATLGGYGVRAIVVVRLADDGVHAYHVQCGVGLDREMCLEPS